MFTITSFSWQGVFSTGGKKVKRGGNPLTRTFFSPIHYDWLFYIVYEFRTQYLPKEGLGQEKATPRPQK